MIGVQLPPDRRPEVAARVCALVAEHLAAEHKRVTDQARLVEDLGADSLDILEMALIVDEAFGIAVNLDAVTRAVRVRDLVEVVLQALGEAPASAAPGGR